MRVGLFVTCLVDLMRPSVAFAAVKLLEDAGCTVLVPAAQTCCGQPALNSGDNVDARDIAKRVIQAFEGFDHVVGPSGSCMGTRPARSSSIRSGRMSRTTTSCPSSAKQAPVTRPT